MGTMTSKGQVTVPKAVRDALGLRPGTEVVFELTRDGRVAIARADSARPATPDRFARMRGVADAGLSTDEILALMRGDP